MGDSEMTNLPILYQNCLLQYSSEITKKAWLWFADRQAYPAQDRHRHPQGLVDNPSRQPRPAPGHHPQPHLPRHCRRHGDAVGR